MKIAICIPGHGDAKLLWSACFAAMMFHAARNSDLEITTFLAESSSVASNRAHLVQSAQEWEADAILWLDIDHTFPADALLRLINHDKPVVGANYPKRTAPSLPTAKIRGNGGEYLNHYTTGPKAGAGLVEQVFSLGFGLCLVRMDAIRGIEWPLFQEQLGGPQERLGEDVFFFGKLEAAGVPVFLDHALSWQVGHITQRVATNAETGRIHAH